MQPNAGNSYTYEHTTEYIDGEVHTEVDSAIGTHGSEQACEYCHPVGVGMMLPYDIAYDHHHGEESGGMSAGEREPLGHGVAVGQGQCGVRHVLCKPGDGTCGTEDMLA